MTATRKDYLTLFKINCECDDALMSVLNRTGAANLTVCPECHVDDFTHVEGCTLGEECKHLWDNEEDES